MFKDYDDMPEDSKDRIEESRSILNKSMSEPE
jgi:hypothetical protein